jgi:N-acyl amino acid synthase of PEP-CTERM/exosortase system
MFESHFEVFLADTDLARKIHYQLRYDIYCEEREFEDASVFSEREEVDLFDERAVHFIIRDIQSKHWVAAMRLVLPGGTFPITSLCKLDREFLPDQVGGKLAEISRLCIKREAFDFDCVGASGAESREGILERSLSKRQVATEIIFRFIYAAYDYSNQNGIGYWYFLATPALARMVSMAKIPFTPAGAACNHNGVRVPYFADIERSHGLASNNSRQIQKIIDSTRAPYALFSSCFGDDISTKFTA